MAAGIKEEEKILEWLLTICIAQTWELKLYWILRPQPRSWPPLDWWAVSPINITLYSQETGFPQLPPSLTRHLMSTLPP